jgi:putative aldouronate transport system substrate-binding protein
MKRMCIAALVLTLLVPALALAGGAPDKETAAGKVSPAGQFPVTPKITLKAGYFDRQATIDPKQNLYFQKLEQETGIQMQWVVIENDEKRNILFASDDYPNWSMADGVWKDAIAQWLDQGVVVDLLPYLNKGYTPNLDRVFKKYPQSLGYSVNPSGKLPALPQLLMLESNYLEQNFMINKKWLDKLGLQVPRTLADLRTVLVAFKDKDPNGNGKKDEMPFGFVAGDGYAQHLTSLYGLFGMPTKEGVAIKDGKAYFAPVQPAYKQYIQYMAGLYKDGLIDQESFTQTVPQFDAKVQDPGGNKYGFIIAARGYTGTTDATKARSEFMSIEPPRVPGIEPEMWVHPGRLAIKNVWIMTNKNPYPQHTMAWVDRFYTFERTMDAFYGMAPEGYTVKDGKYVPGEIPLERRRLISAKAFGAFPSILEAEDYGNRLVMDKSTQFLYDNYYKYYIKYKAKEQWVRPEFSAAETKDLISLQTDIDKLWKSNQARWITGAGSVDAEWDQYVQQMKTMNLDKYVALYQVAHDRFLKAMKDIK